MQLKRKPDRTMLMMALTLTTGMIEAVSFIALGPAFTAVQTGNTLFLAFALGGTPGMAVWPPVASLCGFAAGAVIAARLESRMDIEGRRWYVLSLVAEAVLLAVAGLVAWELEPFGAPLTARHYAVIALVAVAMGMRNVTMLRAPVPDMSTTVLTRSMTALLGGSSLGRDTRIPSGAVHTARRAATVGTMIMGGLLGAWMLHENVRAPVVLLIVAGCVLAVASAACFVPRVNAPESG
ncbi:YoaK family protein [Streptomyces sp. NPDC051776]|uniref:YoaK family protein n=1 Tax=Streptomyces sp. NPDC051776 TaxID=3155414 RepID=UPI00341BA51B